MNRSFLYDVSLINVMFFQKYFSDQIRSGKTTHNQYTIKMTGVQERIMKKRQNLLDFFETFSGIPVDEPQKFCYNIFICKIGIL